MDNDREMFMYRCALGYNQAKLDIIRSPKYIWDNKKWLLKILDIWEYKEPDLVLLPNDCAFCGLVSACQDVLPKILSVSSLLLFFKSLITSGLVLCGVPSPPPRDSNSLHSVYWDWDSHVLHWLDLAIPFLWGDSQVLHFSQIFLFHRKQWG